MKNPRNCVIGNLPVCGECGEDIAPLDDRYDFGSKKHYHKACFRKKNMRQHGKSLVCPVCGGSGLADRSLSNFEDTVIGALCNKCEGFGYVNR